jgi:formylglycine-generating enzyme
LSSDLQDAATTDAPVVLTSQTDASSELRGDVDPDHASLPLVHCPVLSEVKGVAISTSGASLGHSATYSCSSGYYPLSIADAGSEVRDANTIGDSEADATRIRLTRYCQADSTWSGSPLECTPVQCPVPIAPENGTATAATLAYGSAVQYQCSSGYCLAGTSTRTCQSDGAWSGTAPTCRLGSCTMSAPPSCAAGGPGAGPSCGASGKDDCCASPVVQGGSFKRASAEGQTATVSSFRFDKYLVTVGRFRSFVAVGGGTQERAPAAGSGAHAKVPGSGWNDAWSSSLVSDATSLKAVLVCGSSGAYATWNGDDDRRPINCTTWAEAFAFCIWDGGRLPTELEWNYAASGGDEQRPYPWGNTPLRADASQAIYGCFFGPAPRTCSGRENIAPVGAASDGPGRWGQMDLVGELLTYGLDWYRSPLPAESCTDCAIVTQGTSNTRVNLGAGFSSSAEQLKTDARFKAYGDQLSDRSSSMGFRCARAL